MPARRMAGDENARRIAAMRGRIAMQPRDRRLDMLDDVRHAHLRDQRIVDHGNERAQRHEALGDKGKRRGIERLPEAAMDEYMHRRRMRALVGIEQIERRLGPRAIGNLKRMAEFPARRRRGVQAPLHDRGQIRDRIERELRVECGLCPIVAPGFHCEPPSPS